MSPEICGTISELRRLVTDLSVQITGKPGNRHVAAGLEAELLQERVAQLEAVVDRLENRLKSQSEQLAAAERQLPFKMLNAIPDMFGYWDRNLKNVYANDAYVAFFGRSPEEILGRHISWLLGESIFEKNLPYMMAALRGETQVFEREIPGVDGSKPKYALARYIPVSEEGAIQGFFAVVTDVTPLHEQRKQLEEARLQLAEAQRIAKIGSWSLDLQSADFAWSEEYFRIFEITESSGTRDFSNFYSSRIHPDDIGLWEQSLARARDEGLDFSVDLRLVMANKSIKWVRIIGKVHRSATQPLGTIFGTCQDRTDEVKLTQELELEQLKNAHQARLASMGEMAAGIAHEINNPLAVVYGYAELILRSSSPTDQDLRERAGTIKSSAERMARIVRSLKKFARVERSKTRSWQLLSALMSEATTLVEHRLKTQDISLEIDIQPGLEIWCDDGEMVQVFVNLLSNAIDAIAPLSERWVRVLAKSEGSSETVVQVRDSGRGIAPTLREKLFQPFFTTKPVGVGTGLGLAIVKGMLEDHQASIDILPNEAHTCFELRFARVMEETYGN